MNLVNFLGSVAISEKPLQLGLLFEWCDGGTLASTIDSADYKAGYTRDGYPVAQRIIVEIVNGVKYLHDHGIVHRNLKPESIMVRNTSTQSNSIEHFLHVPSLLQRKL